MVLVVVVGMSKNSLVFLFGPEVFWEYLGGRRAWVRSGHRIQNDQKEATWLSASLRISALFFGMRILNV